MDINDYGYLVLTLPVVFFLSCKDEKLDGLTEVVLTNNFNIELTAKVISIKRDEISEAKENKKFPLLISNSDTIPSQLTDLDGDGKWDELFFVMDFESREERRLDFSWTDTKPNYKNRTNIRFGKREAKDEPVQPATEETILAGDMPRALGFQKYQTDGPTWENDKVAFRYYLDGRNSKDIFGKKTSNISPEDVGLNDSGAVEDNYHTMEDWGRDIFPVGNSVGLGGFAIMLNDEVHRLGVTVNDTLSNIRETKFEVIDKGPVKSVLKYNYSGWQVKDEEYDAEEITRIYPGIYGFKNTVKVDGLKANETLLIGLSNINNENPIQEIEIGDWVALIAHDYQTYEREWLLGTALVLPRAKYLGYIEAPQEGDLTDSFLAKIDIEQNQPVSYYAIAGWEKSQDDYFNDIDSFKSYVINQIEQISAEISILVEQ